MAKLRWVRLVHKCQYCILCVSERNYILDTRRFINIIIIIIKIHITCQALDQVWAIIGLFAFILGGAHFINTQTNIKSGLTQFNTVMVQSVTVFPLCVLY